MEKKVKGWKTTDRAFLPPQKVDGDNGVAQVENTASLLAREKQIRKRAVELCILFWTWEITLQANLGSPRAKNRIAKFFGALSTGGLIKDLPKLPPRMLATQAKHSLLLKQRQVDALKLELRRAKIPTDLLAVDGITGHFDVDAAAAGFIADRINAFVAFASTFKTDKAPAENLKMRFALFCDDYFNLP